MAVGEKFISDLRAYANTLGSVVVDIGEAAIEQIKAKTLAGEHGGGRKNVYNEKYARRKGVSPSGPVTLRDTGAMMGSLQVQEGTGGSSIETRLGGGQIRGPVRAQFQSIRDVSVNIVATDPKAQYYTPRDQVGRTPFQVEELWVQEAVDAAVRHKPFPGGGSEQIEIRAL